jgi:hypothetical protein
VANHDDIRLKRKREWMHDMLISHLGRWVEGEISDTALLGALGSYTKFIGGVDATANAVSRGILESPVPPQA